MSPPSSPPPSLHHTLPSGPLLTTLCPGYSTLQLHVSPSGALTTPSKPSPLYNLYQRPVHISTDPSSTLLLLIGVLRAAVIFHPDPVNATYKVYHFLLPGTTRLTTPPVVTATRHTFSITHNGNVIEASYNEHANTISVTPSALQSASTKDLTPLFRRLLSSIDVLTAQSREIATKTAITESKITAYNTLLTAGPTPERPTITRIPNTPPTIHTPNPASGRVVYLNIALSKSPGSVECSIRKSPLPNPSTLSEPIRRERVQVVTAPIHQTVSLPFVLDSHRPLDISLELLLHGSGIPLTKFRYDILDFSAPTQETTADTSRDVLVPVHAMMRRKRLDEPVGTTATRLQLPIPLEKLSALVTQGRYETLLGGVFTLTLSAGLTVEQSVATAWGARHIIPFVRAAVLRRVLDWGGCEAPGMGSAPAVRKMQKLLLERCDEWLPSFRRAEDALVKARDVFERIEGGAVEECYGRGERVVLDDATRTGRACYGMLRRGLEGMWSFGNINSPT